MTQHIILFPALFQMFLALGMLFYWSRTHIQIVISVIGNILNICLAITLFHTVWTEGTLVLQAGNWEAPFGITFVADTFSATLVLLTSIIGTAVSLFIPATVIRHRLKFGFLPLFHFLLMGVTGVLLTGDIFNLYVWFEIIHISSFVLLALGSERYQLQGAVKYFTLNMLASIIFLTGLAILYGLMGTLNMADLAVKAGEVETDNLLFICAMFFFVGFGIKSAIFPMYFWLPDSYHTPPTAVSAIFSGLLTKVGVYAIIRVFSLVFLGNQFIADLVGVVAIISILSGGAAALLQNNLRKVFAYLIICHIGFLIAGLGIFNEASVSGTVYYMMHDMVVKANLFLIAGLVFRIMGTEDLRELGGLYASHPKISLLIAVTFFSVIGIPPLSGFWPKIGLIRGSLEGGEFFAMGAILFGSFLTLMALARVWSKAFWRPAKPLKRIEGFVYFSDLTTRRKSLILGSIAMLTAVTLYFGFGAEQVQSVAQRIATEIIDKSSYVNAVFGL